MKKKLFMISMVITIIGIIIVAVKGFNVDLKYKAHQAINIPIGVEFNISDIKSITDEVLGKEQVKIEKAGIYNDEVIINTQNVSEEQIDNLRKKINEKYSVKQNINMSIEQKYALEDVQSIAREVLKDENITVTESKQLEDAIVFEYGIMTKKQEENLTNKINEKYNGQKISFQIGKEFKEEDIQKIGKEVLGKDNLEVKKVDKNSATIEVTEPITDEQKETLNTKINEKYEIEEGTSSVTTTNFTNTVVVNQVVSTNEMGRVRLTDMAKQYILYTGISAIIILVYFAIRFRKNGVVKTILSSIAILAIAELFYMSIIAIIRYPINKLAITGAIAIYMIIVTYLNKKYMKQTVKK